jgi:hypothetical protein
MFVFLPSNIFFKRITLPHKDSKFLKKEEQNMEIKIEKNKH